MGCGLSTTRFQPSSVPDGVGMSPISETRALRNTSSRDWSATAPVGKDCGAIVTHPTTILLQSVKHTHQALRVPLVVDEQGTCFGALTAQHVDNRVEGRFLWGTDQCVHTKNHLSSHSMTSITIPTRPRTCAALSCSLLSTSKCTVERRRPGITPSSMWSMVDSAL